MADRDKEIWEYLKGKADTAVPVQDIRRALNISEVNVVELFVLKNLNDGQMELTPKGVRLRQPLG